MEGNIKQWALHYAGMGMAVFPIKPRSKQPLTDHGLKDAPKDPAQIESWWNRWPTANIGITTGAVSGGLVMIDLDVDKDKDKGIDGRVTLQEWEAEHEKPPNSMWLAIAGRGGYHYFYYDTSIVRSRTGIYEGIDTRGDSGYVVAPPSIYPNGNIHEWEQDLMLYSLIGASGAVFGFFVGSVMKDPGTIPFEVPEQIPDGQRTTIMVKLVCSQQAKGLSDDATMAAVRVENETKCVSSLTEKELKKEVFPAPTHHQKGTAPCTATYDHKTRSSQPIVKKGLMNSVSMDTVEEKEPEWQMTDHIPRGQITVLVGGGGLGKTTVWCSIVAAVSSSGRCFLNQDNPFAKNCVLGRVMLFSSEDSAEYTSKGRLRRSGTKLENVLFLDLADERFPETKFNTPLLEDLTEERRPEWVISGPLQSYVPSDIQMGQRNAMRACLNPLIGLGEKYGTAFIIIVYTNKQAGLWGRKRITDSADTWDTARNVLIVGEANGGLRYISQKKSNYGPLAQTVLFHLDSGKVESEGYADKKDKDYVTAVAVMYRTPAREDAKVFILGYLKDGEKETADLDGMMKAMGISKGMLERAKAELKKGGQIVCFSRGFKPKICYCKLTNPIFSGTVCEQSKKYSIYKGFTILLHLA